jgi:hypothetical protein
MKIGIRLSIILVLSISWGCSFFGEKNKVEDYIEKPDYSLRSVEYVPVLPAFGSQITPVSLYFGYDQLLYAVDSGSAILSFDAAGNYTLSGTPSATPVALLYIVTIPGDQYQNLDNTKVITAEPVNPIVQTIINGDTTHAPSSDAVFDALALKLAKCHTMNMAHSSLNPADSLSYYFAANAAPAATSSAAIRRKPAGITGHIYSVTMQITISTTLGTSENSTFKINNVTQGTTTTVSTTLAYTAVGLSLQWDLVSPFAVTKGDQIECQIDMPAFATNPVAVIHYVDLLIYGF